MRGTVHHMVSMTSNAEKGAGKGSSPHGDGVRA
jgi:hypothetical protein